MAACLCADAPANTEDIPTNTITPAYCQHYSGVLWIRQGNRNGAAGTIFYLFLLNQLLYAERHHLQPWIHLNHVSRHVYDPQVHGVGGTSTYTFPNPLQVTWENYHDHLLNKTYPYPGNPLASSSSGPVSVTVQGNGVWKSYFESVVPLTQKDNQVYQVDLTQPCTNLPLLQLATDDELVRGLHLVCPYCVRAWKYGGMPPSLKLPTNYEQLWMPMRQQGKRMVAKCFKPLLKTPQISPHPCLAVHIRHSDKANRRDKIPLKAFLPYCQAFVQRGGQSIYLATDSSRILDKIQVEWPSQVIQAMTWQSNTIRSSNTTAIFEATAHHHRTNQEVLWDIQQLAKCRSFLHGLSAVSEAANYTSTTFQTTVNLEFYTYYQRHKHSAQQPNSDAPPSIEAFQEMLQKMGL